MASRLRRRKRSPWGLTLVLLLVLIALIYATARVYFRPPDQKAPEEPAMVQKVDTPVSNEIGRAHV